MAEEFRFTEEQIEKALNYLKYHDPENANRDKAIALLQDLKSGIRNMAQDNPELLLNLQKELDDNKK